MAPVVPRDRSATRATRSLAGTALLSLLPLMPLGAQTVLRTHDGIRTGEFHGGAVARLADLDGDGVAEYAIGSMGSRTSGLERSGAVAVHSGRTGQLRFVVLGDRAEMRLGLSIAPLDDVDRDGVPDFVVGAPFDDRGGYLAGSVAVHSGVDGNLIWRATGQAGNASPPSGPPLVGSMLGWSVAAVDDVDGDGRRDVLVGAPSGEFSTTGSSVLVLSGATGGFRGSYTGERGVGRALCSLGDLDGDGRGDVAVGVEDGSPFGETGAGYVLVFAIDALRTGGRPSLAISGTARHQGLGIAVELYDDLDGDGRRDLLIAAESSAGAPGNPAPGSMVQIHSGRDGSVLRRHIGPDRSRYGLSIRRVGDFTGDGRSEYAVGAPGFATGDGAVYLYDGADGRELFQRAGDRFFGLGQCVDGLGDLDGDRVPELLVGAPSADSSAVDAGRAYVLRYAPDGSVRYFGAACAGPSGVAALSASGSIAVGSELRLTSGVLLRPAPGGLVFGLSATQWAGGALPLHMLGFGAPGCWLNVEPRELLPTRADQPVGPLWQWRQTIRLPNGPSAYGQRFYLQYLSIDAGAPGGYVLSNGVEVRIGG